MAKFGIAPEWGSGGRWFKSSHSDQGIIGRFETFVAGNGYVGLNAALDQQFIESLYTAIQTWKKSPCSYVDMF